MLVLTRKESESVWLGHQIRIIVVRLEGNRVRLGFDAPPGVRIMRHELLDSNEQDTILDTDEPLPLGTRRGLIRS